MKYFILWLLFAFTATSLAVGSEKESGWGALDPVGKAVNLVILSGVLVYFLRKPLGEFLQQRGENIKRQLLEAERARDEANAKLAEMERRFKGLDDELKQIKEEAEREAAAERQRILESAKEDAERIVNLARREIDGLMRSARQELRRYAAELSVSMAEEIIRREITLEDQRRIFSRFIDSLGDGKK